MTLRELRKNKGITQKEAAKFIGMPLRTYSNYETDASKQASIKYEYIMSKLHTYGYVDEENGVLSIDEIRSICVGILSEYPIDYCYLFGSYAKGKATPTSDIDLFISTSVTGIKFFELVEELRDALKKRVDVLHQKQITNNFELANEILKDGIKIYG